MTEQPTDPRSASTPAVPAASSLAPRSQAEGVAHGLRHSFPHPELYQHRPGRLAQPGEAKYIDQCWAGLIDDPATMAAERQRREQARRADVERKARAKSISPELVRDVLAAARARGEG
jgi:hypothetical protein